MRSSQDPCGRLRRPSRFARQAQESWSISGVSVDYQRVVLYVILAADAVDPGEHQKRVESLDGANYGAQPQRLATHVLRTPACPS